MPADVFWHAVREFDLFDFWRAVLTLVCTVYAALVTLRSLWGWVLYFSGAQRATTLMRHYVIVQLLRLRVSRFRRELASIAFWSAAFFFIVRAHVWI